VVNHHPMHLFDTFCVGSEWRTLPIHEVPDEFGIKNGLFAKHLGITNLLDYYAAQAMRWKFLADINAGMLGDHVSLNFIETRLVRVSFNVEHKTKLDGYGQVVKGSVFDTMRDEDFDKPGHEVDE
jgi:hypothetical protein